MALSHEIMSQFAKLVTKDKKTSSESTVYGTVVVDGNGNKYVKLDGSDQLTPLSNDERPAADSATANANEGERVSVLIKNHTATVTGNVSSPAARTDDVEDLEDQVSNIKEFDILIGQRIEANEGYIKKLQTDKAGVGDLTAANAKITELETEKASVKELEAAKAEITDLKSTKIDAEVVKSTYATIENLNTTNANITNLNTDYVDFKNATGNKLSVVEAEILDLETDKLSAKDADLKYANIDFSNIGDAAVEKLFTESGIIKDLVVSEGKITGELVGVTIKGDLIEGNTVKADKLVVKGSDGLYYKLNFEAGTFTDGEVVPTDSLHGSVITAKSIVAEKISVDDLVAFGATIGGFHITTNSIYSGVKESVNNTTNGIYLDNEGQVAFGDGSNYFKYFKDTDGSYKLEISALDKKADKDSVPHVPEVVNNNTPSVTTVNTLRNGIKNIRIFGKTTQNGVPSPDVPIEPTAIYSDGTASVAIKSKNLYVADRHLTTAVNGFIVETLANGVVVQGTDGGTSPSADAYSNGWLYFGYSTSGEHLPLEAGQTVTISADYTILEDTVNKNGNIRWRLISRATDTVASNDFVKPIVGEKTHVSWTVTVPDGGSYYILFSLAACLVRIENLQIELGAEETAYESGIDEAIITVTAINGLHGLLATSNATYSDADGRQWICDEIDLARGVHIQRIGTKTLASTDSWTFSDIGGVNERAILQETWVTGVIPVSNCFKGYSTSSNNAWSGTDSAIVIDNEGKLRLYRPSVQVPEITSIDTLTAWLDARIEAGNPVVIWYALAEPIETLLSEDEISAFANLTTSAGTLHISNGEADLNVEVQSYATSSDIEDLQKTITEQSTFIVSNNEQILMSALEKYELKDDADTFKGEVRSQLEVTSSEINMRFEETQETIASVDSGLQTQIEQFKKHISFSENGIIISASGENQLKLRIDNGMIAFYKGTTDEEPLAWWDGDDFHTGNIYVKTTEQARFGNFAFVPRDDGSLSFYKVGD